jgi:hypothetical protein
MATLVCAHGTTNILTNREPSQVNCGRVHLLWPPCMLHGQYYKKNGRLKNSITIKI